MRNLMTGTVALVVLCITGCSPQTKEPSITTTSEGQKSKGSAGTAAARADTSLVRFINADSDMNNMDLWSEGVRVFSNVAYRTTTPYMELQARDGEFALRKTGEAQDVAAAHRETFPGRHYTLVGLPEGYRSSRLAVLSDKMGELEPGQARVRLINATTGVADLDLYLAGTNTRIGHGVDPGSANSFTDVKPGMLDIRQAGQPAYQRLSKLKLDADRLYTFVVTGAATAPELLQIVDRID